MGRVFGIPPSSIITVCDWTMPTQYSPEARGSNVLHQRLFIPLAASDAMVTY